MAKKKKKYISKKNAVTFQVVHRSQQDPLTADETAPQHVLKEYSHKKNKEEEHKYGIFFDDEYDYLQHLKSVTDMEADWNEIQYKKNVHSKAKESSDFKVNLPSSVFESELKESVGLLNKAAPVYGPRPELDPDIVAAMDDDFDYDNPENLLEDNFVELANHIDFEECLSDLEEKNDIGSEGGTYSFDEEISFEEIETKSRFTNYSLTSSVIRRNEQLQLLDEMFENKFKSYDNNEIGCLPCEEIEGMLSSQDERLIMLAEKSLDREKYTAGFKRKTLLATFEENFLNPINEDLDFIVVNENEEKWDCESILSTYSNIYNHPGKISEPQRPPKIKINKKGIPEDIFGGKRLTTKALSMLNDCKNSLGSGSVISQLSELSIRSKNETPEERRLRKNKLKEYRMERRIERKANTQAFKEEKLRQEKLLLNAKNQKGIKLV